MFGSSQKVIRTAARVRHTFPKLLETSEGMSRVEVALENDDEDPGELSRLAGLYLGLADVKDAVHRFKISKLYCSFFALPEVQG